jgi:hypothetical protein
MSKLIKRADGSYSKRGLWDNIRANKGSKKKPTKQMLEQERKIKKEEKMKMEYKKGGKKSTAKKSFMEDSKEIKFGAPGVKFSMTEKEGGEDKKMMGGKMKYKNGGPNKLEKPTADSTEIFKNRRDNAVSRFEQVQNYPSSDKRGDERKKSILLDEIQQSYTDLERQKLKGRAGYDKNGNPKPEPKGIYPNQKDAAEEALKLKKGGKKTMEPGGGGRFAKMVNKMKGEGKSEESAKAIAASIGRKKYGKSKFQEMAAVGKKKMGGKKC